MTTPIEGKVTWEDDFAPFLSSSYHSEVVDAGRNFWNKIALPYINKLDGLNLPDAAINNFQFSLGYISPFGIQAATQKVMFESLRLKDEAIYEGIIPDELPLQALNLWSQTLNGIDIKTFYNHDTSYAHDRLFGGNSSIIFASKSEFTFIGNPNDQVVTIPNPKKISPRMASDVIIERLAKQYGLTDREIKFALNGITGISNAVIHLSQIHENSLTPFTLRAGDLTTTKVVAFGANGYYQTPSKEKDGFIRIVFEDPNKLPDCYLEKGTLEQVTAKDLELDIMLHYKEGYYNLIISNIDNSDILAGNRVISYKNRPSYLSINK